MNILLKPLSDLIKVTILTPICTHYNILHFVGNTVATFHMVHNRWRIK